MTTEWVKGEGPFEWVDETKLHVGDVVLWMGERRRIATLHPYAGPKIGDTPLVVTFYGGGGFTVWRGQRVQRVLGEAPPGLGLVWLMTLEGEYDSTRACTHAVPAVEAARWCELADLCEDVDVLAVTPPGLADGPLGPPAWVFAGPRAYQLRTRLHHTDGFCEWVLDMYRDALVLAGRDPVYSAHATKRAQLNLDCARAYFARAPGGTT